MIDPKVLTRAARALEEAGRTIKGVAPRLGDPAAWPELDAATASLDKVRAALPFGELDAALGATVDELRAALPAAWEGYRAAFGRALAEALSADGLRVEGQFPELRVGPLVVTVDPRKGQARLAFGPDEVARERATPERIAQAIRTFRRELLEAPLDAPARLAQVYEAWRRARRLAVEGDERVPVADVLTELNLVAQAPAFRASPSARTFKPVTRVAFAWDLYRLRRERALVHRGARLGLHTAVYDDTRQRVDHLWVPDDEQGGGTRVARLSFRREEP